MTDKIKLCLLADGESIHVIRWVTHFASLGHEIHLITFKNVSIKGINVHFIDAGSINVGGGNWKVLLHYRNVKRIIKAIKPDLLHAMYATSYGIVGALTGFHPYIITPLGTDILISPQQSFIYKILLQYALGKADYITSLAPHMTDAMKKLGVPESKIGDMIFGIDTSVFNQRNRKLPADQFVITSMRSLEPIYNISHFIKAIALVKSQIPGLKVNIIGVGSLHDELKALARDLKINETINFLGKVSQNEIVEILNQSHICVSVSLSDGSSLSLLEAMACGAYPIATDILANHQWLKEGVNGSFVKINDVKGLADCMMDAYNNYDRLINKALQENHKIIEQRGAWKTNMQRMEQKYEELVKNSRK